MGSIERVDRPKPWPAVYRVRAGVSTPKVSLARSTPNDGCRSPRPKRYPGQWVDPTAGAKLFGPYAEQWIAHKRSAVGETTVTNTESLLRARVLPGFDAKAVEADHDPRCATLAGGDDRGRIVSLHRAHVSESARPGSGPGLR